MNHYNQANQLIFQIQQRVRHDLKAQFPQMNITDEMVSQQTLQILNQEKQRRININIDKNTGSVTAVKPFKLTGDMTKLLCHCRYVQGHFNQKIVMQQLRVMQQKQPKVQNNLYSINDVSSYTVRELLPLKLGDKKLKDYASFTTYKKDGKKIFGKAPIQKWKNVVSVLQEQSKLTPYYENVNEMPNKGIDAKYLFNSYTLSQAMFEYLCTAGNGYLASTKPSNKPPNIGGYKQSIDKLQGMMAQSPAKKLKMTYSQQLPHEPEYTSQASLLTTTNDQCAPTFSNANGEQPNQVQAQPSTQEILKALTALQEVLSPYNNI